MREQIHLSKGRIFDDSLPLHDHAPAGIEVLEDWKIPRRAAS
jgi:hypothetical protein